ncbi:MAG: hypothetical protein IH859_04190, partial [Chloroflexi bacterium]|nr:hypothetical protein [Chloroflexota bacterium]
MSFLNRSPKPDKRSADPRLRKIIQQLDKQAESAETNQEEQIKEKILQLVDEFANGAINQQQFLDIYRHYRNEQYALKAQLNPGGYAGNTLLIRNRHKSNTLAYAIYKSDSGIPLGTRGDFPIDPALLIPMLASYHSAAKEIFGQGINKAEVVGGKWMSFIVGQVTTMITIIENEPSASYMETLTRQHELFEHRNAKALSRNPIRADEIDFP